MVLPARQPLDEHLGRAEGEEGGAEEDGEVAEGHGGAVEGAFDPKATVRAM